LVVLVDENSASASEIFAAAIKDHQRGRIVGHQSYGKGSVQGIFPLNAGSGGMRLTTAKFYSPRGNPISQVGVSPDVTIAQVAKPAVGQADANRPNLGDNMNSVESDPVLTAGINIAKQEFAKFQAALGR
jgi:carboxyl-terminal processing protease